MASLGDRAAMAPDRHPGGAVSQTGQFETDTSDMAAVHRAIRGGLDAAPDYVAAATDPARVEVVGSFYDNLIEFLHVHHQGEDEILYPLLEQRCPHERESLELIDAQHRLLDEPMGEVRGAIAAWRAAPSEATSRAVIDAIARVDEILTPHLADEEALVVPLASAHLSAEEWGQLPAHAMQAFSGDKPWLGFGLVFEQFDDDQRERIAAGMPDPVREMLVTQWMPAFDAFIAEVRA